MKIIGGKKYTVKDDLQKSFFGIEQYRPGDRSSKNFFIRLTSGTTGGQPTMVASQFLGCKSRYEFFFFKSLKRVLTISYKNNHDLRVVQTYLNHRSQATRTFCLSKRDMEHPLIFSVIDDFKPQLILSPPSLLNVFTDKLYGKVTGNFPKKIEKIHLAGEMLSRTYLNKFVYSFPKSEVKLFYSMSETSIIGTPCRYLTKKYKDDKFRIYHPVKAVSIVEPDQTGAGEISVYTPELSHYLTGDAGKIIKEKCKCGASETLFLYGRINYDIVHCVGATFHASEVERVFSLLGGLVKDYYLEIKEIFGEGKTFGSVTISIVPTQKLQIMKNCEDFVAEFVKKHLRLTKTRCLGDLVDAGIFLEPKISLVTSLPESGKKVRMRKVDA